MRFSFNQTPRRIFIIFSILIFNTAAQLTTAEALEQVQSQLQHKPQQETQSEQHDEPGSVHKLRSTLVSQNQKPIIVLDPGHGGSDLGAHRGPFIESEIVLQIALKAKNLLLNKYPQYQVYLTRESNQFLSLEERVDFAKDKVAQLYLSIHANSLPQDYVSGMEFFIAQPDYFSSSNLMDVNQKVSDRKSAPAKTPDQIIAEVSAFGRLNESLKLGKILQNNWVLSKSSIKQASYYVVGKTTMPALLMEVGFISNNREAKKLITDEYQTQIAQQIVDSVHRYFSQIHD